MNSIPHLNLNKKDFLKVKEQFQLGHLLTEKPHPKTVGLSELAQKDLNRAILNLKTIDSEMMDVLLFKADKILELSYDIEQTLKSGGKVFLCGCGATGRLSLSLETIFRLDNYSWSENVVSFMAGGDVALIRSIEQFEDYPEYGKRQLTDLGFGENDLLISTTEGGETPFVIGATQAASEISKRRPYFLFCNPDELLKPLQRCREVFENPSIHKINLTVGPMVLSGSTRMQASTILMAFVGIAFLKSNNASFDLIGNLRLFSEFYQNTDLSFLNDTIQKENQIYQSDKRIIYECEENLAICILTDTTERSPTFSLIPFENKFDNDADASLCYIHLINSKDVHEAWRKLLQRTPRTLEWSETLQKTSIKRLEGFDFSNQVFSYRAQTTGKENETFKIRLVSKVLTFSIGEEDFEIDAFKSESLLWNHLFLKMILNIHSTLLMGLRNRYQSNIMTWVRPSNYKLIDRTIRYTEELLAQENIKVEYENICETLFKMIEKSRPDSSLVLELVDHFRMKQ